MKHNLKVTAILLIMFLVTQFIGLYVVSQYTPVQQTIVNPETGEAINITDNPLPPIFQTPEPETQTGFWFYLIQIVPAFIIAIFLVLILSKYKLKFFIKLWFFIVVIIALYLSFYAFLKDTGIEMVWLVVLSISLIFAILKVFRPGVIVHNFTELLIYPGIAAIFVPILNIWTLVILLIAISIYDMWAVWHSGIMQKMAKFQMQEVGIFGGFFVPYLNRKVREQIQKIKDSKSKKAKKVRIQLAILGGGDVVFPISAAGVLLRAFGILPAVLVIFGAFAGLLFLLLKSEKKKFYPAMPFITAGIFFAMLIWQLMLIL
jgi:presenilin-like A22 family membrane protease